LIRNINIERYPQVGNPDHITYVKKWQAITAGQYPFAQIEWWFGQYGYLKDWVYTGHLLARCDTIFFILYCPCCNHKNRYTYDYKPAPLHYESLIAADAETQEGFECAHCHKEFVADEERNIYFK
jgi:hypothetical protein